MEKRKNKKSSKALMVSTLVVGGAMAFAMPHEAKALRNIVIDHGGTIIDCMFTANVCLDTLVVKPPQQN